MDDEKQVSKDDVEALIRGVGKRREAPRERERRVRRLVEDRWRQKVRSHRRRRWWLAAAGAAAAVGIAALGWGLLQGAPPSIAAVVERSRGVSALEPGDGVRAGTTLRVPNRSGVALRLPGGASLRVDENTRVVFHSGERFTLEYGALYFDSAMSGGPDSTISIETRLGSARNSGTSFETRFENDALQVRVRDGAVTVESEAGVTRLNGGEGVRVDAAGGRERHDVRPYGDGWRWASALAPAFALDGESLASFLEWASRESGLRVEYGSDALAAEARKVAIEGSIEELTPRDAIDAVLPTTGFLYTVRAGVLRVDAPVEQSEAHR